MALDLPNADDFIGDPAGFAAAHAAYRADLEARPLPDPAPYRPDPRMVSQYGPPAPHTLQKAFYGPTMSESERRRQKIRQRWLRAFVPDLSPTWATHAARLDSTRNPTRTVAVDAFDLTFAGRNRPTPWRRSDRTRTPVLYSARGAVLAVRGRIPLPCPPHLAVVLGLLSCRSWETWTNPQRVRLTDVAPPQRSLRCEGCGMPSRSPHLDCTIYDEGGERLARLIASWRITGGTVRTRAPRVTIADRPRPDNVRTFTCRGCGTKVTEPRRQGRPSVRCSDCRQRRNGCR